MWTEFTKTKEQSRRNTLKAPRGIYPPVKKYEHCVQRYHEALVRSRSWASFSGRNPTLLKNSGCGETPLEIIQKLWTCTGLPKRTYIFTLNRKQGKYLDLLLLPSSAVHLLLHVVGWTGIVRWLDRNCKLVDWCPGPGKWTTVTKRKEFAPAFSYIRSHIPLQWIRKERRPWDQKFSKTLN